MTTLGHELHRRGHRVTLVGVPDSERHAAAAGLGFLAVGESLFPAGSLPPMLDGIGHRRGLAALRHHGRLFVAGVTALLQTAPYRVRKAGIDALLVDQASFGGGTVAEALGIPFVTVYNALAYHFPAVTAPPFFTTWVNGTARWARLRNRLVNAWFQRLCRPVLAAVNDFRRRWRMPAHTNLAQGESSLAQITQQPREFDFPFLDPPPWFHYTGPFQNPSARAAVPFPYERLTGEPLVYASLGTTVNHQPGLFHAIAEGCCGLDVQLVLALGKAGAAIDGRLPGNPLVVDFAPQLELLQRAALAITHAGLNTVLEALSYGVPLAAVPLTMDQPGNAARLAWLGAGEVIPPRRASPARLRAALRRLLTRDSYKRNAVRLRAAIARSAGLGRAADIVEQVVSTGRPVLRNQRADATDTGPGERPTGASNRTIETEEKVEAL
jgi:MGT family glycosyltransferase